MEAIICQQGEQSAVVKDITSLIKDTDIPFDPPNI